MKTRKCSRCLEEKELSKYYDRKDKPNTYCKECFNKYCKLRWTKNKIEAIKYLGGKCSICGIENIHPSLYDFHHRDPKIKTKAFGQMKHYSLKIRTEELDKCDLLCCVCHRLHHLECNWKQAITETHYLLDDNGFWTKREGLKLEISQ